MNEFKISDILEIKKPDAENYKEIKPKSDISAEEVKEFWNHTFEEMEEQEEPEKFYVPLEERKKHFPANGEWTGKPGNSKFIPDGTEVKAVLEEYGLDGIEYKNAVPDFSGCAVISLKIDNMTGELTHNWKQFADKYAEKCKVNGLDILPRDIKKFKIENQLAFHECSDRKTCQLIPERIHQCFTHTGGRMECGFRDNDNGGGFGE